MALQKKQFDLDRAFSKHYKKLSNVLTNKKQRHPTCFAFASASCLSKPLKNKKKVTAQVAERATAKDGQSTHIFVLAIDTIKHKDFPNIVDIAHLGGLKTTKKAALKYQGKTKLPKAFIRLISNIHNIGSAEGTTSSGAFSLVYLQEALKRGKCELEQKCRLNNSFSILEKMQGAGVGMYHYELCFSSHLQGSWGACSNKKKISGKGSARLTGQKAEPQTETQGALSKAELTYITAQALYKVYSSKKLERVSFSIKSLSNILGAFVMLNSSIYYISDRELIQCGLAGSSQHLALKPDKSSTTVLSSLLKIPPDTNKRIHFNAKTGALNIALLNRFNRSTRLSTIHDFKKPLNQLFNILAGFAKAGVN